MSCRIHVLLERGDADAADRMQELLAVLSPGEIDIENATDGARDFAFRHRRPDDVAERDLAGGRAAERDLVPLLAVLIDAEDADVTDMMVAARIHAARHLDLDVAEVVKEVEVVEALL